MLYFLASDSSRASTVCCPEGLFRSSPVRAILVLLHVIHSDIASFTTMSQEYTGLFNCGIVPLATPSNKPCRWRGVWGMLLSPLTSRPALLWGVCLCGSIEHVS